MLQTSGLLLLVLVAVVALLPLLGAPAMLLPAPGWVALAIVAFILIQLVLFRLFGLHSRADEEPEEPSAGDPDPKREDQDWRAWRG
jgi:hypothetical protein